jgi:predicted nucleic acid-binding protein
MELVASSECSAYDCEFVALAEDLGIPLVTVDKKLLKEFPQIAVSLDEYIEK